MSSNIEGFVGDVKGVIILDNEGARVMAKYYNSKGTFFETLSSQKAFERTVFQKSNKVSGSNRSANSFENDIMTVDNYVAIFRMYSDFSIFIIGHSDDNELILGMVLDCIHECFDRIFRHNIERKSLINNMSGVILVIDELFDQGIVMHLDPNVILARIKTQKSSSSSAHTAPGADTGADAGGGLFASVFSGARSQLAKTMGM